MQADTPRTIPPEWRADRPRNTPRTYSTEQAANRLNLRPQTLRAAYCRAGHYCNVIPYKRQNRFLSWPADEIDRLATGVEAA